MKLRILVVALIVSAACLTAAESRLQQLADWPMLTQQAKECGVEYRASVKKAETGDSQALRQLFRATRCTDGAAADMHCAILHGLLEEVGDAQFSTALSVERGRVRDSVTQAIDFDIGHPWQKRFPRTYALGSHNEELLRRPQR